MITAILVYAAMVIAATAYAWWELDSLSFNTRDFPFYVEFCVRLGDPNMTQAFSLNPEGTSILRYGGIEGARTDAGLHQAVHLEPIKYVWAALYDVFGTRGILSLLTALCLLPVLYVLAVVPGLRRRSFGLHLLVALCYGLYPSAPASASFDLRPFVLLLPFFSLALFSLLFKRRGWETLLFFNLLFTAREEALVLGLGIVLIAFAFRDRSHSGSPRSLPWVLLLNWGVWVAATASYYLWTGYETSMPADILRYLTKLSAFPVSLIAAAALAGAVGFLFWTLRHVGAGGRAVLALLALSGLALLPTLRDLRGESFGVIGREVLYSPQDSIAPRIALLSLIPLWLGTTSSSRRRQIVWGQAVLALVFVFFSMLPFPDSAASRLKLFRERRPSTTAIREFGSSADPYKTAILCDLDAYQAVCHVDNARVYERWPNWIIPGEARVFPGNASHVRRFVEEEADYVAMGTGSADVLIPLLSQTSARFDTLFISDLFLVLEVEREPGRHSPQQSNSEP